MEQNPSYPPMKSPYMDLPQAAYYCCFKESTFRSYIGKRLLPSYKIGKKLVFKQTDLDAFIEKHLRRSNEQLDLDIQRKKQELNGTYAASATKKGGASCSK